VGTVCFGLHDQLLVDLKYLAEFADGQHPNLLVRYILHIGSGLRVHILLLQIIEHVKDTINGIIGLSAGLQ
jgi:hypothetical protein